MQPKTVDIFVPRPLPHEDAPKAAPPPGAHIRIVPNDVAPATSKKPAFDHLRPRYVVQRTQPQLQVQQQSQRQPRPVVSPQPSKAAVAARPTVDGLAPKPRPDPKRPSALLPPSIPQIQQAATRPAQSKAEAARGTKKPRWRKPVVIMLAAPCMLAAGLMLQSVAAGEVAIGVYAVIALVKRIESRLTFMLALVALFCIVVLLLARPDQVLMQNFAIYAFLFIVVGTVSLTMETRY